MTPKTVPFTFQVETFQGEALDPPITVTGQASEFSSPDEARSAGVWPNDATVLEWLNSDELAKAKANARANQLKDKMEEYQKSDKYRIAQAVKALVALGYSNADAQAMAAVQSK